MKCIIIILFISLFFEICAQDTFNQNEQIISYIGKPVILKNIPKACLKEKLKQVFSKAVEKAGVKLKKIIIDDSEYPFYIAGIITNNPNRLSLRTILQYAENPYRYRGAVSSGRDPYYFSVDILPSSVHPFHLLQRISKRSMLRLKLGHQRIEQTTKTTSFTQQDIINFLGDPVICNKIPEIGQKEKLQQSFAKAVEKAGLTLEKFEIDDSEYPFYLSGVITNNPYRVSLGNILQHIKIPYKYSGAATSGRDPYFFAMDILPSSIHPTELKDKVSRRKMIRLQMQMNYIKKAYKAHFHKKNAPLQNERILKYLGSPVLLSSVPEKYTKEKLLQAFTQALKKTGIEIMTLHVDTSEHPFYLYGIIKDKKNMHLKEVLKSLAKGYKYSGAVTFGQKPCYFAVDISSQELHSEALQKRIYRRKMLRLEILVEETLERQKMHRKN